MPSTYARTCAQYASSLGNLLGERYRILTGRERALHRRSRLLPGNSLRYRLAHKGWTVLRTLQSGGPVHGGATLLRALRGHRPAVDRTSPDAAAYQAWCPSRGKSHGILMAYGATRAREADAPLISIVLPTYRSDPARLQAALRSVLDQSYTKWELLVVDDASCDPDLIRTLEELVQEDPRIHFRARSSNGGIAAATQDGIAMARGEYVTFLDHDDLLLPFALAAVARAAAEHPDGDVLYSDEVVMGEDGSTVIDVALKPSFSPALLLATNYICHLLVVRRSLLGAIGGMRGGVDGSQDYDLILRATEAAREVVHIPEVLYLWNEVPGSVITGTGAKPYAYEAGRRALSGAVGRRGLTGLAPVHGSLPGWYSLEAETLPPCTVVIPDIFPGELLQYTIAALRKTAREVDAEILVVRPNGLGTTPVPGADAVLEAPPHVESLPALLTFGAEAGRNPLVVFCAPGIIPTTPGWLQSLLPWLLLPDAGACAPRILSHTGIPSGDRYAVPGDGSPPRLLPDSHWALPREASALPWSCLAVRREALRKVAGLHPDYLLAWFDADLSFQLRKAGYRVLSVPTVTVHTLHGSGSIPLQGPDDEATLLMRFPDILGQQDPYLHPAVLTEKPFTFRT